MRALAPTYLKLMCVAAIYGGHFAAGRYLAPYLPYFTSGALRYLVAVAVLALLLQGSKHGWPRLAARDWGAMLVLGATGVFLFNAFFFLSLQYLGAGRGSLISALTTVATSVGAWLVFRTRLDSLHVIGIALALAGVAVVVSRGEFGTLLSGAFGPGELAALAGVAAWVIFTLIGRAVMRRVSPLAVVTYSAFAGTAMLVAAAVAENPWKQILALPAVGWLAIGYLGIIGTVLTSLWFMQGVQRIGPTRAAVFFNFVPIFAVLLGWLLLDEPLLPSLVIGGVIVLLGVALTNRPARTEPAAASRTN